MHFSIAAEKDPGSPLAGKKISLFVLLNAASDPYLLQHQMRVGFRIPGIQSGPVQARVTECRAHRLVFFAENTVSGLLQAGGGQESYSPIPLAGCHLRDAIGLYNLTGGTSFPLLQASASFVTFAGHVKHVAGKKKTKSPPPNYAGICTDSVLAEMKSRGGLSDTGTQKVAA